jgi:hypothetical protein
VHLFETTLGGIAKDIPLQASFIVEEGLRDLLIEPARGDE